MPTFALTVVSMRYTSHIHLAEEKFGRTKKKKLHGCDRTWLYAFL